MIEFVDNNKIFFVIDMSLFFVNKNFDFRMIIELDEIFYEFIRERLLIVKVENIIDIMINILKLMQNNLKKFKRTMTTQINKHKKIMIYNFENKI